MSEQVTVVHTVWVNGRDANGEVVYRVGGYHVPEDWSVHDPTLVNAKDHRDEMTVKNPGLRYTVEVKVETTTVDTQSFPIDL